MILAILLSTFSLQVTSVILPCSNSLRVLAASNDIETTIIETYANLLKNIPLDELLQLQKNPLVVPQAKKLLDITSYQSVFQSLITFIKTKFSEEKRENFILPRLKVLIDDEIQEKTRSSKIQKLRISKLKNLQIEFKIFHLGLSAFILSSNGKVFYSASDDRTIRFWNARTGEPLRNSQNNPIILNDHSDWIRAIALSPNGKIIYSGSHDNTIRFWNAKTGEPLRNTRNKPIILNDHSKWISTLALSPNGKILYSGSYDTTIRLWNAKTGEPIRFSDLHDNLYGYADFSLVLRNHSSAISRLALSPNGKILYSGSDDHTIRLWNATTGEPLHDSHNNPIILKDHEDRISALALSPNGRILYSGSDDHTIRLWNATTGEPLRDSQNNPIILKDDEYRISALALSPNGKILYSGSYGHTIRLWNATTGEPLRDSQNNPIILKGHIDAIANLTLSPNGKILYSGSYEGKIITWYLPDVLTEEYLEATP